MNLSAKLDTSNVVKSAESAADALRSMKGAAEEAGAAIDSLQSKLGAASSKSQKSSKSPKPEKKGKSDGDSVPSGGAANEKSKKPEKKSPKEESKAKSGKANADKDKGGVGSELIGKGALGAVGAAVAAIGVAVAAAKTVVDKVIDMAPIAMGVKGMMQLNAITMRAEMNFKRLFKGVDPSPVLRAYSAFTKNFSDQTVVGKELGIQLSGMYNGLFSAIEAVEPYATAFMKGAVIGVLDVETAAYSAGSAFLDLLNSADFITVPLLKAAGAVDWMGVAAEVAKQPFESIKQSLETAKAAATAIASTIDAIKSGDTSKFFSSISDLNPISIISNGITNASAANVNATPASATTSAAKSAGPSAKASGQSVGVDMGVGIMLGLNSTIPGVEAAGAAVAGAAEAGARKASETHSPSRKMARFGGDLGDGVVVGLENSADKVQKAAQSSLVPNPAAGSIGSLMGGLGAGNGIHVSLNFHAGSIQVSGPDELKDRIIGVFENELSKAIEMRGQALALAA